MTQAPFFMPNISHNNHFKFGYNGVCFSQRTSKDDVWFREYGKLSREPLVWRDECIETAKIIREDTDLPITVLFSGGLDSNVVVESFRLAKIPVSAAIIKMDEYNQHDIKFAIDYCEAYSIPYKILYLDILKFWENELFDYAIPTYCRTPQFLPHLWAIDQIDGFPVIGMGEAYLERNKQTEEINDYDSEQHRTWDRWLIHRGRDGAPEFFKYTPESKVSHLLDHMTVKWVKNAKKWKHSTTKKFKYEMYSAHFPNLVKRPEILFRDGVCHSDYTGFEYLYEVDLVYRAELEKLNLYATDVIKTEYKQMMRELCDGYEHLYEKLINDLSLDN